MTHTQNQLIVLAYCAKHEVWDSALSYSAIAKATGITMSGIQSAVRTLDDAKLLVCHRDKKGRALSYGLEVTQAGQDLLAQMEATLLDEERQQDAASCVVLSIALLSLARQADRGKTLELFILSHADDIEQAARGLTAFVNDHTAPSVTCDPRRTMRLLMLALEGETRDLLLGPYDGSSGRCMLALRMNLDGLALHIRVPQGKESEDLNACQALSRWVDDVLRRAQSLVDACA